MQFEIELKQESKPPLFSIGLSVLVLMPQQVQGKIIGVKATAQQWGYLVTFQNSERWVDESDLIPDKEGFGIWYRERWFVGGEGFPGGFACTVLDRETGHCALGLTLYPTYAQAVIAGRKLVDWEFPCAASELTKLLGAPA